MNNQEGNNFINKQKVKKYGVLALMFVIFAVCLWLIFAPSKDDKQKRQQSAGINSSVPAPKNDGIFDNKKDAYERELLGAKKENGMHSLQDYALAFSDSTRFYSNSNNMENKQNGDITQDADMNTQTRQSPIGNSVSAFNDINKSIGSFNQPQESDEREQEILALEWRIQELERKQDEELKTKSTMNEQVALMEKSYQLAAKYMPSEGQAVSGNKPKIPDNDNSNQNPNGKAKVTPVSQVFHQVVSALNQDYPDKDIESPRNTGFNTMDAIDELQDKNTIAACVNETQTLLNGQSVYLRLLEPMMIGNKEIPVGTLVTGRVNLQGERLEVLVSSIEYDRMILPVKLSVFDVDGQKGLYIPGSMEMDALKEMIANTGNSMGSSISITDNAGSQIASDLTRGVIQGTSQYFSKKIKMVKVTLKAGHKLYLTPDGL